MGRPRKPKLENLAEGTTVSKYRDRFQELNDFTVFETTLASHEMTWEKEGNKRYRLTHVPTGKFLVADISPNTSFAYYYYCIDRLLNMIN